MTGVGRFLGVMAADDESGEQVKGGGMMRKSTTPGAWRGRALSGLALVGLACAAQSCLLFSTIGRVSAASVAFYVAPSGSDANPGTSQAPFQTIQRAASMARAPGTIVHVAPGVYASASAIYTQYAGASTARIVFVSDTPWAARIIVSGAQQAWYNSADYVDIVGFDVTNTSSSGSLGIDNFGSYTRIIGNHVHNVAQWGCPSNGGAGIDDHNYAASGDDVIGNVVDHIGPLTACTLVQGIYHSNRGGHIWNNIAYASSGYGIHCWHADTDIVIGNNLVFGNRTGGVVFGAGDAPGGVTTDNMVVTNNIVTANAGFGIRELGLVGAHNQVDHNNVYNNSSGAYGMLYGVATNALSVDPQFVTWQATGGGDYHLRASSPLINAGTSLGAPSTDFDGNARPQGQGFDIGPYEFTSSGSGAPPVPTRPTASTPTASAPTAVAPTKTAQAATATAQAAMTASPSAGATAAAAATSGAVTQPDRRSDSPGSGVAALLFKAGVPATVVALLAIIVGVVARLLQKRRKQW